MRIGSLFSGAGGLDLAVESVFGADVAWHCEIDPAASKVLEKRWPGIPNLGDVSAINWHNWKPVLEVDILCGGFPCQDVSSAGKRAGIKDGTRSGLWSVFADVIDHVRPTWVVIENVRGLLSARAHRNLEPDSRTMGDESSRPVLRAAGAVLGDLADLGYDAQWATVAAADVGAPHRRERVFVLASHADPDEGGRGGWREASWGDVGRHNEIDGGRGSFPAARRSGLAADAPRDGWDEGRAESARIVGGFDAALGGAQPGVALLPTPRASDPSGAHSRSSAGFRPQLGEVVREFAEADEIVVGEDDGAVAVLPGNRCGQKTVWAALNGQGVAVDICSGENSHGFCIAPDLAGTKPNLLPTPADGQRGQDFARANREGSGGDDLVTLAVKADRDSAWGKYEPAIRRWEALTRPAPAPTEPNKNGNPRLAAAFSEWMMGWPAGHVTDPAIGISRNDQLRIIGNGVCPQQAIHALTWLIHIAKAAA